MNQQKKEWLAFVQNTLQDVFKSHNVKQEFVANEKNNMYQIDDKHFVICDAVFSTPIGCYVFEFLTKKGVQYRFSSNNQFLWEINLKTRKKTKCKTNWVQLFQVGKKLLDQANHKYNRFCLMAHVVNFEGSSNGIYGVTPHSFPQLFDLAHEVKW